MLTQVKEKNKLEEKKTREEFQKQDRNYTEVLGGYDTEMREHTKEKDKAETDKSEPYHELEQISDEYKQRMEERKKREETLAFQQKKEDE